MQSRKKFFNNPYFSPEKFPAAPGDRLDEEKKKEQPPQTGNGKRYKNENTTQAITTAKKALSRGKNIAIIIIVSMKAIMRSAGPPRNLEQGTFQSLPN